MGLGCTSPPHARESSLGPRQPRRPRSSPVRFCSFTPPNGKASGRIASTRFRTSKKPVHRRFSSCLRRLTAPTNQSKARKGAAEQRKRSRLGYTRRRHLRNRVLNVRDNGIGLGGDRVAHH